MGVFPNENATARLFRNNHQQEDCSRGICRAESGPKQKGPEADDRGSGSFDYVRRKGSPDFAQDVRFVLRESTA